MSFTTQFNQIMDIKLIQGGAHSDKRGTLEFFNDFDMAEIKRLYIIQFDGLIDIRAWQGHKVEQKWFFPIFGSFEIKLVKPCSENWSGYIQPHSTETVKVSAGKKELVYVPGGFFNGIKSLEKNGKLIVFSDFLLSESLNDDYRLPVDYWEFD